MRGARADAIELVDSKPVVGAGEKELKATKLDDRQRPHNGD